MCPNLFPVISTAITDHNANIRPNNPNRNLSKTCGQTCNHDKQALRCKGEKILAHKSMLKNSTLLDVQPNSRRPRTYIPGSIQPNKALASL